MQISKQNEYIFKSRPIPKRSCVLLEGMNSNKDLKETPGYYRGKEQQAYHNKWFLIGAVSMVVTILVGYCFEWERHVHLGDKHVEWQEFSVSFFWRRSIACDELCR